LFMKGKHGGGDISRAVKQWVRIDQGSPGICAESPASLLAKMEQTTRMKGTRATMGRVMVLGRRIWLELSVTVQVGG